MKKLLVLSGDPYHIPFIEKAVQMGVYVITCDYFEHNPGHAYAHEYHNVSYMDQEAVLELAKTLQVDGITCFAADEAMTTVSYVAEKLGLASHPTASIDTIHNKEKFRAFLKANHFNVPLTKAYSSYEEAKNDVAEFTLPIIVKPVDSSGSRGVSKVEHPEQLQASVNLALSYSKSQRFLIEQYIESDYFQVGGDGFSVDGKLVFRSYTNNHLSVGNVNPFIPLGGSWPSVLPQKVQQSIDTEIERLLTLLNMKTGPYNFDIRIDANDRVYFIEMGARNGGNSIPEITKYATGVDLIAYTIKAALGEDCSDLRMIEPHSYWACYTLHSDADGVFNAIHFDSTFKRNHIAAFELLVKPGDKVSAFSGSDKKLGACILTFTTLPDMLQKLNDIKQYITIEVVHEAVQL